MRGRPPGTELFISKWQKAKAGEYSPENTGYTFVEVKKLEPYVSSTPTSCQMKRPPPLPESA